MIFESLSLHNFGAYLGEHSIQLSTSPSKPVVLIGALNGSGKTTLLEAVQLALFGKAVRGTSRSRMSYGDYLLQSINRNADPELGAAVSLDFRQRHSGHDDVFSVTRTWRKTGDVAKETLRVLRNGVEDPEATDRWLEFVEEFLPVQIADLFLFDGERIESLADPERSTELLRTGVHALLGLDLVDHLSRSLQTLERRKRSRDSSTRRAEDALKRAEVEQAELQQRIDEAVGSAAAERLNIDGLKKDLERVKQSLLKEGGELFAQRERFASDHLRVTADLEKHSALMSELASGDLPLLLVRDLLAEGRGLVDHSRSAAFAARILEVLAKRDAELLRKLKKTEVDAAGQVAIRRFLEESRGQWERESQANALGLNELRGFELSDEACDDLLKKARLTLRLYDGARDAVSASEVRLAAIPSEESLKIHLDRARSIESNLQTGLTRASLIEDEIRLLRGKMERLLSVVEARRIELVAAQLEDQDASRIVLHSERARATLSGFREAVASKNIARLEHLVAERFKALLRKTEGPVQQVRIDPRTFELQLLDRSERPLNSMLLSAGERQLLAVATVWALAKASGRALPTIIDTPLGRLDSEHRTRLVDNYFPAASHQVVLLSTDEEINGRYYERLKPKVAREYVVRYDAALRSSFIEEGYFRQQEAAA